MRGVEAYVYAAFDGSRHKIGRSANPKHRLPMLSKDAGRPVAYSYLHGPTTLAYDIENTAHFLLADHQDIGEWFNVDAEAAVAAIRKATEMVEAGDFPKKLVIRGPRQLPIRLDEQLDAALRPGETRKAFLKAAVQRELEYRRQRNAA